VTAPFPEVIDASMLNDWRSCRQRFWLKYINHWKPKGESVHLVAGKAYAEGLEAARRAYYEDGQDSETAIARGLGALLKSYGTFECPAESAKNPDRMAGALEFYFDRYPLSTDAAQPLLMPSGKRAIEFSFAQPLPVVHPVTGNPLIYSGRSDMVARFAEGNFIEDDKTTSSLGASWSRQWALRSQFTGYCWAAGEIGLSIQGVLVRGVSILKTKYDTLQAITYRPQWQIRRWLDRTVWDLNQMVDAWRTGFWPHDLSEACNEYGGCSFRDQVCSSENPADWLPMYFERKKWDPLTREETLIVDEETV
jgi:hypothetical protein